MYSFPCLCYDHRTHCYTDLRYFSASFVNNLNTAENYNIFQTLSMGVTIFSIIRIHPNSINQDYM